MHDYDPSSDYTLKRPTPAFRKLVMQAVEHANELLPELLGVGPVREPFFAARFGPEEESFAVYVKGTSSDPVFGFVEKAHRDLAKATRMSLSDLVVMSVAHEYAHAYFDSVGAALEPDEEEAEAERFARDVLEGYVEAAARRLQELAGQVDAPGGREDNPTYAPLSLAEVRRWEPVAASRGVSEVARGPGGFLEAYRRAGGKLGNLSPWWRARRSAFLARHLAQVELHREPLFDRAGRPTRRHLALVMWAHSPEATRLRRLTPG